MIGHLRGEVLFSDGHELIIQTVSGIGYQVFFGAVLAEGSYTSIFVSHIIKEGSEELYGFKTLREKKMFELAISVKGVGPKSAFALLNALSVEHIIEAVTFEQKKTLQKAPGIGAKAAAQMILDLTGKVQKIKMYSNKFYTTPHESYIEPGLANTSAAQMVFDEEIMPEDIPEGISENIILSDAIMACKELGFQESQILPIANKMMGEHQITKPEQLVHLVLKEI